MFESLDCFFEFQQKLTTNLPIGSIFLTIRLIPVSLFLVRNSTKLVYQSLYTVQVDWKSKDLTYMEEVTSNYEKRRGQIRSAVFVAFFLAIW